MSNKSESNKNRTDESMSHSKNVIIKIEQTEESLKILDTIEFSIPKMEVPGYHENGEFEDSQQNHPISLASYPDPLLASNSHIKKEKQEIDQKDQIEPSSASSERVVENPTTVGNNGTSPRSSFERMATAVDPCRDDLIINNEDVTNILYDSPIDRSVLIFIPKLDTTGIYQGDTVHAIVGNRNGQIGYSQCYNQSFETAQIESIKQATQNAMTISRCMYNFKLQKYFTVPYQVTGKSANVTVTLSPHTGDPNLFATSVNPILRILQEAGIHSCIVIVMGTTDIINENLLFATFEALQNFVN